MYSVLSFPLENVRSSLAVVSSAPYSWDAVTCGQHASHAVYSGGSRARWCRSGNEPSSWIGRRKTAKRNTDETREKVNSYVSGPFLSDRFSFERFYRTPWLTTAVFLRRRNENTCLKKIPFSRTTTPCTLEYNVSCSVEITRRLALYSP